MGSWSPTILGGDAPMDAAADICSFLGVPDETRPSAQALAAFRDAFEAKPGAELACFIDEGYDRDARAQAMAFLALRSGAALPAEVRNRAQASCIEEDTRAWNSPLARRARLLELYDACAGSMPGTRALLPQEGLFERFGRTQPPPDSDPTQALFEAVAANSPEAARKALDSGADPCARRFSRNLPCSEHGADPLMCAAASCGPEMAVLLLQAGADPSLRDNDGWSAFFYACLNPDDRVWNIFFEAGSDQDFWGPFGFHMLAFCANEGQESKTVALAQALARKPGALAELTDVFGLALCCAARTLSPETCKILLPLAGAGASLGGKTPCAIACERLRCDNLQVLYDPRSSNCAFEGKSLSDLARQSPHKHSSKAQMSKTLAFLDNAMRAAGEFDLLDAAVPNRCGGFPKIGI